MANQSRGADAPTGLLNGELVTVGQAYSQGVDVGFKRRNEDESRLIRGLVDKMSDLILKPGNIRPDEQRSTPGSWPAFRRAAEHLVSDLDAATAATPHGVYASGSTFAVELAATWMNNALPAATYTTMIEAPQGESGWPTLPKMFTSPTAGAQGGEKLPAYSKAFDIQPDETAGKIDSTLYLNVSGLVIEAGFLPIVDALMGAAVAHEANKQIVTAIEAVASTAADAGDAFGTFDGGRFIPSVVVLPPSQVLNIDTAGLVAAGVRVQIDPAASNYMILSPDAVVGWFKRLRVQRTEPSLLGEGIAFGCLGRVSVDPAGVARVTGP